MVVKMVGTKFKCKFLNDEDDNGGAVVRLISPNVDTTACSMDRV